MLCASLPKQSRDCPQLQRHLHRYVSDANMLFLTCVFSEVDACAEEMSTEKMSTEGNNGLCIIFNQYGLDLCLNFQRCKCPLKGCPLKEAVVCTYVQPLWPY